jgi:uncharacterized coiled-coil protein SlyX
MAKTKLQSQFPLIRSREEILAEIQGKESLKGTFEKWNEAQKKLFLDVCSGAKGVKMLYDSFFKEIFNPEFVPERLEELLSLILEQKVRILKALPNDTTRIADESSLLIMDIVVQLEDGSIANVECQKLGYAFPGQRAACYSADLLLRQYKRVRGEKGENFTYRDIKKVYTIIFFEKSPSEFRQFPEQYIHRSKQHSDTGIKLELLQEFVMIPLDIFFKVRQNIGIRNKLEAWLTFLGSDDPEIIMDLIQQFSYFTPLYEEVYELCRNTEKVMGMFSKELKKLDDNTVRYMMDEMQNTIDEQADTINNLSDQIADKDAEIEKLKEQLAQKEK